WGRSEKVTTDNDGGAETLRRLGVPPLHVRLADFPLARGINGQGLPSVARRDDQAGAGNEGRVATPAPLARPDLLVRSRAQAQDGPAAGDDELHLVLDGKQQGRGIVGAVVLLPLVFPLDVARSLVEGKQPGVAADVDKDKECVLGKDRA